MHKGDYTGGWDEYSDEMGRYCQQDGEVTAALMARFQKSKLWPGQKAVELEHSVAWILARQERYGFAFDSDSAAVLYRKLAKRRVELTETLERAFRPWYMAGPTVTPKRSARVQVEECGPDPKRPGKFKTADYTEGVPYQKIVLTTFNPASRDHVANRLIKLYGWEPTEYTDDGKPKVDETVLKGLPYPEASTLEEYFTVLKRLGQLAEGGEAWMKKAKNGRIHGAVNTNGAVTGRMTHAYPNVAQVPATRSPYGAECRALFYAPAGKLLVGADADALELRCLAHFMALFDGGEYVAAVNAGKKSEGTDAHSVNAKAIGLDPKAVIFPPEETGRDVSKTWFYAFIYGAGLLKLGTILLRRKKGAQKRGKESRESFMEKLPALDKLIKAVQRKAKQNGGYIRGLDGRWVRIRSDHAALNTLLQGAGALVMKRALVILDTNLQEAGFVPGQHYEFVANVHDEWQIECDEEIAETVGRMAVDAIRLAGESFSFRCPLTGAHSVGRTWADTH